jgi:hypothetical protein
MIVSEIMSPPTMTTQLLPTILGNLGISEGNPHLGGE